MTRRLVVAALAAAALLAAGCGEKKDTVSASSPTPLNVMLDFFPNADHVGLYTAQAHGDFRRAGLDVHLQAPPDPAAPLKLLQAGKVDLAISYEPEVLLARDKGAPLVSVAAIVQRPLTSLIALPKARVRTVRDLAGKRVGTAGIPYQAAYLRTILTHGGVAPRRVTPVDVGFNLVPAMLSGKVDATLGGFWNYEGVQLRRQHRNPVVLPVDRIGVPTYDELVVVAREDALKRHGSEVRRFVQALGRAQATVRRDPAAGVSALLSEVPDLRRDRGLQAASVRALGPAFFPADRSKPFGFHDRAAWERYANWMFRNHLLTRRADGAAAATNEFTAGNGA